MKALRFALTIIGMMIATPFSWSQEKIGPSYIWFVNQIGCDEPYDVPTLGEIMATCDTLRGFERELLLQEFYDELERLEEEECDEDPEDTVSITPAPTRVVVLIIPEENNNTLIEDKDDTHSLSSQDEDPYAIKAIVVEEDEYRDFITVSMLREDGWLLGVHKYRSMEYISLAGYVSFLQEHIFIGSLLYQNSQRLRQGVCFYIKILLITFTLHILSKIL